MIEDENKGMEHNRSLEEKDGLTKEQRELAEFFLPQHPEKNIPKEERVDSEKGITELDGLLATFEGGHSLEALYAIIDLLPKDAPNHPVREPARKALVPIVAKLNFLKEKTNVTPQKYAELDARYKNLSRAVGMINNGKVIHS